MRVKSQTMGVILCRTFQEYSISHRSTLNYPLAPLHLRCTTDLEHTCTPNHYSFCHIYQKQMCSISILFIFDYIYFSFLFGAVNGSLCAMTRYFSFRIQWTRVSDPLQLYGSQGLNSHHQVLRPYHSIVPPKPIPDYKSMKHNGGGRYLSRQ